MNCELCNSAYLVPDQRLCEPCIEAVARLWTIAHHTRLPIDGAGEGVEESSQSRRPAKVVTAPISALL